MRQITGESLRLSNLTKHYGAVRAVNDVSLDIKAGEFVSLLGPSGSGKTTTLMMIAGFEIPSSGQILLGNRPITDLPPHYRGLGVVFQNYALFPHLSVFENIAFPLRMRDTASADLAKHVGEALELVRMTGYEQRFPHELSGGQQQRIALARSLVFRPSVVLMDEPLGALDKQLREHMQIEIKQVQSELGMTVVYVTHDQSEALAMSDRIVIMNNARIEQVGSAEEVYEKPQTRFVASFIGDSNFICGERVRSDSQARIAINVAGKLIHAESHVASPGAGGQVTVLVRPEKIKISNARDTSQELNVLEGRVVEAVYLGSSRRYKVQIDGADQLFVTAVTSSRYDQQTHRTGDAVFVTWAVEDTRLIAETAVGAVNGASATSRSTVGEFETV